MFWKPIFAVCVAIVTTILLFFCIYVMAYFIILGGMHTFKKLKTKWLDINTEDSND